MLDLIRLIDDDGAMKQVPGVDYQSLVMGSASGSLTHTAFRFTPEGCMDLILTPEHVDIITAFIEDDETVWTEEALVVVAEVEMWAYAHQSLALALMRNISKKWTGYSWYQLGHDFATSRAGLNGLQLRFTDPYDELLSLGMDSLDRYMFRGGLLIEMQEHAMGQDVHRVTA